VDQPTSSNTALQYLISSAPSDQDRARLYGCICRGSGDWINSLPSNSLGLCLTDEQFRISCGLRLGAPVSSTQPCLCGAMIDSLGNHQLVCPRLCARLARHSMCNEIIKESLRTANIPSTLEPIGLLRSDGRRPDGVTLIPFRNGKSVAWDFTCVNRLATSHINCGVQPGTIVANNAEARKTAHYIDLPPNYVFHPIAIEAQGGIGDNSWQFLRVLASRIERVTEDKRSFFFVCDNASASPFNAATPLV
jgi:hypothetical protein